MGVCFQGVWGWECKSGSLRVPPASRGNRVSAPLEVPLAKRGEPNGGGQFINSERAIGIISSPCAVAAGASRRPIPQLEHDVQQKLIDDLQQPPHLSRPPLSLEAGCAACPPLSLEPARAARIVRVVVPLPLAHLAVNPPEVYQRVQPAPHNLKQPLPQAHRCLYAYTLNGSGLFLY